MIETVVMHRGSVVSIVVPTYNHAQFVEHAIDSALAQSYTSVEVIVVDDGSTDDTVERLAKYGDRVRVIRQKNAGLAAARNTGIKTANGEYIAFLDSDDAFHPRKLEVQMAYLAENGWPPFIASSHVTSVEAPDWPAIPPTPRVIIWTLEDLVARSRFGSCGVVVKKSCFDVAGLFDESLRSAEDRDMWIRLATRFPIASLDTPLWWYRRAPGSMSRNPEVMERYERIVIDKACAMPELRGRWAVRRVALGRAALSSGFRYLEAGMHRKGLMRIAQSFLYWPAPFRGEEFGGPFLRLRIGIKGLRKMVFQPKGISPVL